MCCDTSDFKKYFVFLLLFTGCLNLQWLQLFGKSRSMMEETKKKVKGRKPYFSSGSSQEKTFSPVKGSWFIYVIILMFYYCLAVLRG